jgi:hypothetical protein
VWLRQPDLLVYKPQQHEYEARVRVVRPSLHAVTPTRALEGRGGAGSYLGAAVGGEYVPAPGGLAQNYQHGSIYWSAATGAHAVATS